MEPPSVNPTKKEASASPPLPGFAGLSVNDVPKLSFPRGDAGWKIVNSSRRISVPNLRVCLFLTHVRLSESTYVFCISTEGRKVGLPNVEALPSLNVN